MENSINLQNELKKRCNWFIEQTEDDYNSESNTEGAVFYDDMRGAYYTPARWEDEDECSLIGIGDDELDEFAHEYALEVFEDDEEDEDDEDEDERVIDSIATLYAIENACDCEFDYDDRPGCGEGYEVKFGIEKSLYVVASNYEFDGLPAWTRANYAEFIEDALACAPTATVEEIFEYDESRLLASRLLEIAAKKPDWSEIPYEDWVSGSVWLTAKQANHLEEQFYIEKMSGLVDEVKSKTEE